MTGFLTQPLERQRVLYEEAGRRLGLSPGSVEKDLWVCWTLRALFRLPSSGPHLTFKGGTSLSKGWKLIDRFSEDIDVVINRESLGFGGADAPEEAPSNKQRVKRLDALMLAAQHHIRDVLGPELEQEIRRLQRRNDGTDWIQRVKLSGSRCFRLANRLFLRRSRRGRRCPPRSQAPRGV